VRQESNKFIRRVESRTIDDLPINQLLVCVHYSSLNYKDALSCIGNLGVTRRYPHIPGIDAAGVVVSSESENYKVGDKVIIIGSALGMNYPGGFSQYIRIPSEWAMHLPEKISLKESMIYGTAGFTAALSISNLLNQKINNNMGPILVTGATGGIGSFSVGILSKLGFQVVASSGKNQADKFLSKLGAFDVIKRSSVNDETGRILLKQLWAACIDTVGGNTLSTVIRSCKDEGVILATGMVASQNFNITVMPFLLRGVKLIGVNAQGVSNSLCHEIWSLLVDKWKPKHFNNMFKECSLETLNENIDKILQGKISGRIIINLKE